MNHQGHCMTIQTIIPDELIDCIAERVIAELKPLLSTIQKKEEDIIFDVKGLAAYLSATEQWVRDKARTGGIPCFKSGKYWKFHKRKIDKHFQSMGPLPAPSTIRR